MEHIKEYLLCGAGVILVGFIWRWILKNVPDKIVNAIMIRINRLLAGQDLKGNPITDEADKQFIVRIGMAFVCWAEKKLPDEGMGKEKMDMVLLNIYAYSSKIPFLGGRITTRLKENEKNLIALIEALVSKMNSRLKEADTGDPQAK